MAKKFEYAPGLPGYGTRGVDGSAGVTGLSTYFSSYDGDTDVASLRTRILSNNILYSSAAPLPDSREYQDGDIFIDKNAKVWVINFAVTNKYEDTGIQINTSGLFDSDGLVTYNGYDRYANLHNATPLLIDNVFSIAAANYAQTPSHLYGNQTRNYGQIKYVGSDSPDPSIAYYAFAAYTTGETDSDAFAIVKEIGTNTFRIGNVSDSGATNLRNTSLVLDFSDVSISGNLDILGDLYVNAINAPNLKVTGDASFNDVYIGGTLYGGSPINVGDVMELSQQLNVSGDVSTGGDLYVDGHLIRMGPGVTNYIRSDNWLVIQSENKTDGTSTYNVSITSGNTTSSSIGGNTGRLDLQTGDAGNDNAGNGGDAGYVWINIGDGGDTTAGSGFDGGDGGWLNIDTGAGGNSNGTINGVGGDGGEIDIDLGNGGNATGGTSGDNGGIGGFFNLLAGNGGSGNAGGAGGYVDLHAGAGGVGTGTGQPSGIGGVMDLFAGNGGNNSGQVGGDGGHCFLVAGIGGDGGLSPGDGGELYIRGGTGGDSFSTNNAGAGGQGRILGTTGGLGWASSSSSYGGVGGNAALIAGSGGRNLGFTTRGGNGGNVLVNGGDCHFPTDTNRNGNGGTTTIRGGYAEYNGPGFGTGLGGNVEIYGGYSDVDAGDVVITTNAGQGSNLIIAGLSTLATGNYLCINSNRVYNSGVAASDIRLKNIDSSLSNTLDKLKNIDTFYYTWNDFALNNVLTGQEENYKDVGIAAQSLEAEFPELVGEFKGDDENLYKTIKYDKLSVVLLQAIKDQQDQIDELKDVVVAQQDQINQLLNN